MTVCVTCWWKVEYIPLSARCLTEMYAFKGIDVVLGRCGLALVKDVVRYVGIPAFND